MKEGEYFRFCFDHVREYNKGFNYFSGVRRHRDRPLPEGGADRPPPDLDDGRQWRTRALRPISRRSAPAAPATTTRVRDPFDLFGGRAAMKPRERKAKPLEAKALETLGLDAKATGAPSSRAIRSW